jgi:hypothetical protein
MERLDGLKREYEENARRLAHPLDLAELEQLKERREAILREARILAREMGISGTQWFSITF